MKTENYFEKIPTIAQAAGIKKQELRELFNGFKTIKKESPFEFIQMMNYFDMKKAGKSTIEIAQEMNISTGSLCSFFMNGFKVLESGKVYSHNDMQDFYKLFSN